MTYTIGEDLGGLRVDLGDVPLGGVDTGGVAWPLTEFEGWDAAETEGEIQRRQGDHGAWAAPVYLRERPMTLTGSIIAPDRAALDDAMDRARAAAALTDTTLTVYESTPKQAVVRRSGKPILRYITDRIASYSLMVTAADGRRYGTVLNTAPTGLPISTGGMTIPFTLPVTLSASVTAGQIQAINLGSADTRPVLRITGPVVAPMISGLLADGQAFQLIYSQTLQAGEVLTIDTDAHTVLLNGDASRRRFLSVPNGWPTIPANSQVSYQFQSNTYNATALLTVSWRSAWL